MGTYVKQTKESEVFDAREVQGVQMFLTIVPSSYFMSLYLAQINMSCELRTFMATDMTVALWWETKVTAIEWVFGPTSGLLQMTYKQHVCLQTVKL